MTLTLPLADHATRDDLRVYLERLVTIGQPEVRLVVRGQLLAVFGCTQMPAGLLDTTPVVLVVRSFRLADVGVTPERVDTDREHTTRSGVEPEQPPVDEVVQARALLDRIARLSRLGLALELPETEMMAAWAGVLPPIGGWQPRGVIDAASLAQVAEQGIARIADALPADPGEPVVRAVKNSVWGVELVLGLPAAVAFAAETMGFLANETAARVSTTQTWSRLATSRGEVLVREPLGQSTLSPVGYH